MNSFLGIRDVHFIQYSCLGYPGVMEWADCFCYFLICYVKSYTLSNERKGGHSHLAPKSKLGQTGPNRGKMAF